MTAIEKQGLRTGLLFNKIGTFSAAAPGHEGNASLDGIGNLRHGLRGPDVRPDMFFRPLLQLC